MKILLILLLAAPAMAQRAQLVRTEQSGSWSVSPGTGTFSISIDNVSTMGDGAPGSKAYIYTEIYDGQENKEAQITPIKEIMTATRVRAVGSTFVNGFFDYNFWSSGTITGSGSITVSSGAVALYASTSTTPNGSAVIQSLRTARFVTGSANEYRAIVRISTEVPATGTNDMRWGLSDAPDLSTTTLLNGFFFKYSNGAFYVGARLNGTAMEVSTGSFNGTVPTIDETFNRYQIVYTNLGASFYVNDILAHKMSATTVGLTATVNFKARAQNINLNGSAAQNVLESKVITINRLGLENTTPVKRHYASGAAAALLKFGPGYLHHVTINDAGGPVSSFTIYDSTYVSAGNAIAIINTNGTSVGNINYDCPLDNGLYVVPVGTFGDLTVVYE